MKHNSEIFLDEDSESVVTVVEGEVRGRMVRTKRKSDSHSAGSLARSKNTPWVVPFC